MQDSRPEGVREILGRLHKAYDGGGYPLDAAGEQIPWGARALKLAFDLDLLEAQGNSTGLAFDILRGRHGWYDPAMLKALSEQRGAVTKQLEIRELQLPDLRPGMILAQDVRTPQGLLLIGKGQKVTFTCSNASGTSPGASEL